MATEPKSESKALETRHLSLKPALPPTSTITGTLSQSIDESDWSSLWRRTRRWLPAVMLVLLFGFITWRGYRSFTGTLEQEIRDSLATILRADIEALSIWFDGEANALSALTQLPEVHRKICNRILASENSSDASTLSPSDRSLEQDLAIYANARSAYLAVITDRTGRVVSSSTPIQLDSFGIAQYAEMFERALNGETAFLPPHECCFTDTNIPIICICGPITDGNKIIGTLSLMYEPRLKFTEVLSVARSGDSGETYAVSFDGMLLSESRFNAQLVAAGILDEVQTSALAVRIQDPGYDVTRTNAKKFSKTLATTMTQSAAGVAEAASSGDDSLHFQTQPYRDYRGVPVIGAWKWLPKYGFGVITEADFEDAFAPANQLGRVLWLLIAIASIAIAGMIFYSMFAQRVWDRLLRAETKLERLGQYELLEKIGSGGMGEVHRARHAWLQRHTAIKLIRSNDCDATDIARFEREVQATSQLQHPNTIQVFDYGLTTEGTFYYAMEFVDGVNLDSLVREIGPLPDGRVVNILKEVCYSLREAHSLGMIHRDIKPSNIMLCDRGGVHDAVKVLDFGLVQDLTQQAPGDETRRQSVAGTPAFMSPEGSQSPDSLDARADIYSLGCVAYFLLAGRPPHLGKSPVEICWKHVRSPVDSIHDLVGSGLADSLADLTMQCLSKQPEKRPQSATELLAALAAIEPLNPWTPRDAEAWWKMRRPNAPT